MTFVQLAEYDGNEDTLHEPQSLEIDMCLFKSRMHRAASGLAAPAIVPSTPQTPQKVCKNSLSPPLPPITSVPLTLSREESSSQGQVTCHAMLAFLSSQLLILSYSPDIFQADTQSEVASFDLPW